MSSQKSEIIGSGLPLELERARKAEDLQSQLIDEVKFLHLRLTKLPPRGQIHKTVRMEKESANPKGNFERIFDNLYDDAFRIAMLLRIAPVGYCVEAEIVPKSYYGLGGERSPFLEERKTAEAVRYYLLLGRPFKTRSGQSELVLEVSRSQESQESQGFLLPHFSIVDRSGSNPTRYLNLNDLLNFRVVPLPKFSTSNK